MKKILSAFIAILLLCSVIAPAAAAEQPDVIYQETVLENGLTVVDEITIYSSARATDRSAERKRSFYDGDTLVAVIAFQATFRYTGTSVSVVSKTITQTDTYSGWSFKQNSFTSSGGTVTLEGTLKYLLIFNSSDFSMSMTCDKNGNISYS